MKAINFKSFTELASMLFDMELETIGWNLDFHFDWYGWNDKYGEKSKSFEPQLTYTKSDVIALAKLIKEDFDNNVWEADKDSNLYDIQMPECYGDIIVDCLEKQLAVLTGVGYQSELNLA